MKRTIVAGFALVAALAVSGCSAVAAPAETDQPADSHVVYPEGYDPDSAEEPVEPASPVETGSLENPFPKGYVATITQNDEDFYSVTFRLAEKNGDKTIAAANQFNDPAPAGYHYVIVTATFTGLSSEPVSPGVEMYDWQIADEQGNLYQSAMVVTDDDSISGAPDLYKGQKFSGVEVYTVPDTAKTLYMSALGSYLAL